MAEPVRIIGHNKNLKTNEYLQAQVGTNGSLQVQEEGWVVSDTDDANSGNSSGTDYFGFVDKTGSWYIMRRVIASGQFRFCSGTSGYALAWTNRTIQTYEYYYLALPI